MLTIDELELAIEACRDWPPGVSVSVWAFTEHGRALLEAGDVDEHCLK